jgi:peroxiredoxin
MKSTTSILIIISVCFIAFGFVVQQKIDTPESIDVPIQSYPELTTSQPVLLELKGKYRPEFSLLDVGKNIRSISEWDGKVLVINFWASWCLPCLKEIPDLVSLQSEYADKGLQVIGIALQKPEELIDFIREYNMNYPVLAGEGPVIAIAEMYGNLIGALPYTVIVDREGTVVYTHAGPMTRVEVETITKGIL